MTFKYSAKDNEEEETKLTVKGSEIVDFIKDKCRSLNIYGSSLLIVLTSNRKLMFFNIDSLFNQVESGVNAKLCQFEKIYSHSSELICSQLIPLTS